MATIYKIEITTVSPFVSYSEKEVQDIFEKFLKEYKDTTTNLGFESTEIKVERE